jgi:hypothetical protein
MDFNYGNIYLELEGNDWVAEILDPDFIVKFGAERTAGNAGYLEYFESNETKMNSRMAAPTPRTALEAQMLRLEQKGWLDFDYQLRTYRDGGYLKVEDAQAALPADWPYLPGGTRTPAPPLVKPNSAPKPPLLSSFDVKQGLACLRAVQAERIEAYKVPSP